MESNGLPDIGGPLATEIFEQTFMELVKREPEGVANLSEADATPSWRPLPRGRQAEHLARVSRWCHTRSTSRPWQCVRAATRRGASGHDHGSRPRHCLESSDTGDAGCRSHDDRATTKASRGRLVDAYLLFARRRTRAWSPKRSSLKSERRDESDRLPCDTRDGRTCRERRAACSLRRLTSETGASSLRPAF